jgi:hypothetical protein
VIEYEGHALKGNFSFRENRIPLDLLDWPKPVSDEILIKVSARGYNVALAELKNSKIRGAKALKMN